MKSLCILGGGGARVGVGGCLPLAVVLLKVCSLQNLYVTLIDLEGGAESDRQAGQDIVTLHEEERLAVDFLMKRAKQRG